MTQRQQRYPSDTSDEQWALIEPLLPAVKTGGRPEKHSRRAIVDGILYVVRAGCAWRQLPADFPPWQTVYWYFIRWEQAKTTEKILPVVRAQLRLQQGRDAEPSAGLIDSQSVKGADTVGRDTRGYDAGNHAGRVVMPGSSLGVFVVAGGPGGAGEWSGITTGLRGMRAAGRGAGIELALLSGARCGPGRLP